MKKNNTTTTIPIIMQHPTVKNYGDGEEIETDVEPQRLDLNAIDFYNTKGIVCSGHFLPISKLLDEEK